MAIKLTSIVSRNEAIVFTELDDTIVMMDADEGCYYELDPVGAKIWALLDGSRSVDELCQALTAQYDIDPDTCRHDVQEFLEGASTMDLVHVQPTE